MAARWPETPSKPVAAAISEEPKPFDDYRVISEKNIFSPERKEFPQAAPSAEQTKPAARPQVFLYGVVIADDYESAIVATPRSSLRKEERETAVLKVGAIIGEYRVAKILPDRITMEAAGDSFEILLLDARKPRKQAPVKTEARPSEVKMVQPAPVISPAGTPPPAVEPAKAEGVERPPESTPPKPIPGITTPVPSPLVARGPNPVLRRNRINMSPLPALPTQQSAGIAESATGNAVSSQ